MIRNVIFFLLTNEFFFDHNRVAIAWNFHHNHHHKQQHHGPPSILPDRRSFVELVTATTVINILPKAAHSITDKNLGLQIVTDPSTYSALAYAPPIDTKKQGSNPLILVLHGAGRNDKEIYSDLADPNGEHSGLIPSLIASGRAPTEATQNFAILAPYSFGKPSFYQDPRRNLLDFVDWAIARRNTPDLPIDFDPHRIFLFGFSDGATVAVELLTTKRFAAGVICSYGYTGTTLPARALEKLANVPVWVFHSKDDVIFPVGSSDKLVQQLRSAGVGESVVRYTRYEKDPENLPLRVRGHSTGISASKDPEIYKWLLQIPSASTS